MKCLLDEDINQCPYYIQDRHECSADGKCSFQEQKAVKPERVPRWYEKYYR